MYLRFSLKDKTFFAKRLSFLISAGTPLLESLSIIREQTKSKSHGTVIDSIILDVSNGRELSKSLSRFSSLFGEFAINIIKAGEASGILSENLNYLAEELKKKQLLQRKIIGALVYPLCITAATLSITAFLVLYLFPKIMPVFLSLKMKLPLSTRIIILVSTFSIHWGLLILFIIFLITITLLIILRKNTQVRYTFQNYCLRLPLIKTLLLNYNIANGFRTLSLLLKSGLTLSNALSLTSETTSNLVYKKEWFDMQHVVNNGKKISEYLHKNGKLFPEILSQMISVGEKSGNLPESLMYMAEFYEKELEDLTKNFSTLVEPILMITMGVIIGFIAISIITPIYSITQGLHP